MPFQTHTEWYSTSCPQAITGNSHMLTGKKNHKWDHQKSCLFLLDKNEMNWDVCTLIFLLRQSINYLICITIRVSEDVCAQICIDTEVCDQKSETVMWTQTFLIKLFHGHMIWAAIHIISKALYVYCMTTTVSFVYLYFSWSTL